MTNDEFKIFREPNEILRLLHRRGNGYILAKRAEIVGLVETPPDQTDVALYLLGDESTAQYELAMVDSEIFVGIAKQILRHFDPSAIDPDTQIHQSLRRIEEHLGTLPDQ